MGGRGAAAELSNRSRAQEARLRAASAAARRIPGSGPFTAQRVERALNEEGLNLENIFGLSPEQMERVKLIAGATAGVSAIALTAWQIVSLRRQVQRDQEMARRNAGWTPRPPPPPPALPPGPAGGPLGPRTPGGISPGGRGGLGRRIPIIDDIRAVAWVYDTSPWQVVKAGVFGFVYSVGFGQRRMRGGTPRRLPG